MEVPFHFSKCNRLEERGGDTQKQTSEMKAFSILYKLRNHISGVSAETNRRFYKRGRIVEGGCRLRG